MGHDPESRFFNPDEYQTAAKFGAFKKPKLAGYKEDSRMKKGCWAPGNYMRKCNECNEGFMGDKRSCICADCSYKETITSI